MTKERKRRDDNFWAEATNIMDEEEREYKVRGFSKCGMISFFFSDRRERGFMGELLFKVQK